MTFESTFRVGLADAGGDTMLKFIQLIKLEQRRWRVELKGVSLIGFGEGIGLSNGGKVAGFTGIGSVLGQTYGHQ